jgi:localization factor PodJL
VVEKTTGENAAGEKATGRERLAAQLAALADAPLEPGAGRPANPVKPAIRPAATGAASVDPNDVKASFIAAARRAAQAAAAETGAATSLSARDRIRPDATTRPANRVSAFERLKKNLDGRRKSILLGVAAIVLAVGVTQIVNGVVDTGEPRLLADATPSKLPANPLGKLAAAPKAEKNQLAGAQQVNAQPLPGPANPFTAAKDLASADRLDALASRTGSIAKDGAPAETAPAKAAETGPDIPLDKAKADAPQQVASAPAQPEPAAAQLAPIPNMAAFGHLPGGPNLAGLRKAVLAGDPAAIYDLAARAAEGRDVPRDLKLAARLFEKVAEAGSAPAQYRLGSLYEKGLGVARDAATARNWYEKAAQQGNAKAMHNLAVLLAEGAAGKPDYAQAVSWFRKAAEFGVRDSQYNLAILLARGLGTGQDLVQSYTWFAVAATQGDADAGKKREEVGARLSPTDLTIARAAAERWQAKTPLKTANEVTLPPGGWDTANSAVKPSSKVHAAKDARAGA